MLFSIVAALFCIPKGAQRFHFLYILANTVPFKNNNPCFHLHFQH